MQQIEEVYRNKIGEKEMVVQLTTDDVDNLIMSIDCKLDLARAQGGTTEDLDRRLQALKDKIIVDNNKFTLQNIKDLHTATYGKLTCDNRDGLSENTDVRALREQLLAWRKELTG